MLVSLFCPNCSRTHSVFTEVEPGHRLWDFWWDQHRQPTSLQGAIHVATGAGQEPPWRAQCLLSATC